MDPVTLILAALAAGVAAGAKDSATQVIKDGYAGLKELIKKRFAGNRKAEETLADHETDAETYKKPLAKQLTESGADQDAEILAKAQELLAAADPQGTRAGKYALDLRGAQVGSIGDHNTNTITFSTPPPAK